MLKNHRPVRFVAAIIIVFAISVFSYSMPWSSFGLFTPDGSAIAPEIVSSSTLVSAPRIMTVGACESPSIGAIEVESTGGTALAGYATLSAAIAAINAGTHTGAINIEVCASTTETAAMFLNSSGAGAASYTSINMYPLVDGLTISGPTVTGRGLIELNGADNVTIDGDNPLTGGTNRNLTITNTAANTVTLTSVIRVAVIAAVPSADNITIRNLNINGSATGRNISTATSTTASENSVFGIYAGGLATGATTAPGALTSVSTNTAASGTTINAFNATNNAVNACARGIFFNGAASSVSTGVTIANNLVGDQTTLVGDPPYLAPTTTVYAKGIFVAGTTAYTISDNSVRNIISYVPTLITGIEINSAIGAGTQTISGNTVNGVVSNSVAGTSSLDGIVVSSAGGPYLISRNTVSNVQLVSTSFTPKPRGIEVNTSAASGTIEKNRVSTIYNRSTGTGGVYGINLVSGNNITVQNNFVWDINENMTGGGAFSTTFGVFGIRAAAGTGHKIYHNSVNLFGTLFGTANSSILSAAFTILGTGQTGIDVRNNIFSNTLAGGTTSIAHVAVNLPSSGTSTMNLTLNNNDYFSGATVGVHGIAHVGTTYTATPAGPATYAGLYTGANFNPADTSNPLNLRTYTNTLSAAATNDNATKVVDPVFVSATDLHIQTASTMESAGANLGVVDDIDGNSRGGSPDIGADEITVAGPGTVQFNSASYTDTEGNTATITVNRVGGTSGAISVDYSTGGGSATAGTCGAGGDYVTAGSPPSLSWANGDSAAKTFTVQLCNDAVVDPGENLQLTLSNPVGTTITGTNPATLNITDNPPGTIQFSATSFTSNEGTLATITATRTGGSSGTVTVDYATSAGTATGGASCGGSTDYVNASGTLSWANNDSASKTFTVQLCSDTSEESTETVNLTLSNVTGGATIGANNPATLNINDVASQFCNADGTITIPPTSATPPFPSTPYPSVINVSGLVGTTSTVRVTLNNISHTFTDDIDVLLVSPTGQKFVLMSDAGGSTAATNKTLTFSDSAATQLPDATFVNGTYRPANYDTANDVFATGAPTGPYGDPGPGGTPAGTATMNATFGGANPNGTWQLFVSDDANGDGGTISGWCLEITTLAPSPGTVQFSTTAYSGNESTTATITATRTGGNAGAISVDYATSDGTATAGTCGSGGDYVAAGSPPSLSWADGDSTAKTFTVQLCPDAVSDPAETVNLTLSNPTGGATIGANNPAVLTIGDVPPPFNGIYTVGTGGNYPSLTNNGGIFEAINLAGATGVVQIELVSDLTGELGTHALNEIAGGFGVAIYTCSAPRSITGSSSVALIRFNGADNNLIEGNPNTTLCGSSVVGGNPALRGLTITNTNAAGTAGVIHIGSNGGNGANGNNIRNVNIVGDTPTTTLYGISTGGATPGSLATTFNNATRIENCRIQKVQIGIFTRGFSQAAPNTFTSITENDLSSTGADHVRQIGISVGNEDGIEIRENHIGGMDTPNQGVDTVGILAGVENILDSTTTTTIGVRNALIERNKINGVSQHQTFSAAGIAIAGINGGTNTIVNNMVTGVISDGDSGDLSVGIFVVGVTGSTTRLYHNSVAMTGDRSALVTPSTIMNPGFALAITGTDPTVELKNNIFYTTQVAATGGAGATSYAIGMQSTTFANLDSNYNDFWSTGANDGGFRSGSLDRAADATTEVDYAALAAWQTATGGTPTDDGNSQEIDPVFINPASDLHLNADPATLPNPTPLIGDGLTGFATVDHDNDPRPAANPEIGADELVQSTGGSLPAGTFYNAVTAPGDQLSGLFFINGALTLNGILNTGNFNSVAIGCNATVNNAGPSNYVVGTVDKQYCRPATFSYPVGDNGWTPVTANVTGGTFPSFLSATAFDATLIGFDPLNSLSRNWLLEESPGSDVTANLTFSYLNGDVNGTEANYIVYRRNSDGTTDPMCLAACVDDTNNILGPVNGVTQFSRWSGSTLVPTAAGVKVSGRVLTPSGAGLRNAKVLLTDSQGVTRTVTTSTFGYYAFDDVRSGETYVMRVVSKRFRYSTRTVQVNDEITNLDFVGLE